MEEEGWGQVSCWCPAAKEPREPPQGIPTQPMRGGRGEKKLPRQYQGTPSGSCAPPKNIRPDVLPPPSGEGWEMRRREAKPVGLSGGPEKKDPYEH